MRLLIAVLLLCHTSFGASFYVATNGTGAGSGSLASPWDLATALTNPASVNPGDTIWMRGGTYRGSFISLLVGTAGNPVTLRGYPNERAAIDMHGYTNSSGNSPCLELQTPYVWIRDLELLSSNTNRWGRNASAGAEGQFADGVFVLAQDCKVINCVIHDCTENGVLSGANGTNTEVSGCLIYYCGYQQSDRGHGHGLYLQGVNPDYKYCYGNVSFNHFAIGAKAYAESPALISGFKFIGNAFFKSAEISTNSNEFNLQIGGGQTSCDCDAVTVVSNYTWKADAGWANVNGADVYLGYIGLTNHNLRATNNYFAGGEMQVKYWTNAVVVSNTWIDGANFAAYPGPGGEPALMDYNTYYFPAVRGNPFYTNDSDGMTFATWQAAGYDAHGSCQNDQTVANPLTTNVFIVPNAYDPSRASIIAYNWRTNDTISVDISGVLSVGARYKIKGVQDFFGTNIASGTYAGGSITLPTSGLNVVAPVGTIDGTNAISTPPESGPKFNVYVLLPDATRVASASTLRVGTLRGP